MVNRRTHTTSSIMQRHSHTAAFIIAFLTMTLVCMFCRITPFGDNTFLYDDMRREYIRYYAYLSSAFHDRAGFYYSSWKSLGGSMTGFFAYYILSPVNILYALFPFEYYPEILTFLSILRFSLLALTSDFFLKRIGLEKTLPFSISFSLCLWIFVATINPLWTDAIIFFPLFLLSAIRLSLNPSSPKAFVLFALATAAQFYINYYMAFMMTLFLSTFMIIRAVLKKITIKAFFVTFISGFLGVLIQMPLLLPVFLELLSSEKNLGDTPLSERLLEVLSFRDPTLILSRLFSFSIDGNQVMFGMPHLFCGTIILPLFLLFFIKKSIPAKDRTESALLTLILFLSFCFPPLDLIWHVGNIPNGYPFRYAWLFVAVMVVCGARAWNEGQITKRELNSAFSATATLQIIIALRCAVLPGIPWYSIKKAAAGFIILFIEYILLRQISGQNTKPGDSPYTSTPRKRAAALAMILMLLCLSDLTANHASIIKAAFIPSESAAEFRDRYFRKKALIDGIDPESIGFYRIEDTFSDRYDSLNDGMVYGYRCVSHYSTGDQMSVRMFLKALGFNYNGLNDVYTADNTDTCDSILNIRYLLTGDGIYENKDVFPSAVSVAKSLPTEMTMDSPFEFQAEIAEAYTGKGQFGLHNANSESLSKKGFLFNPVYITSDVLSSGEDSQTQIRTITFKTDAAGQLYFYIRDLKNTAQDMTVQLNGQVISGYANASAIKILDLGSHEKDEEGTIELVLRGDPENADFGNPVMVTENRDMLSEMAESSAEAGLPVKVLDHHEFLIEGSPAGVIFLSVPYLPGFSAMNRETGEEYNLIPAFGALIQIDAKEAGDIVLSYEVPGLKVGFLISLAGIILMLMAAAIIQKAKNKPDGQPPALAKRAAISSAVIT